MDNDQRDLFRLHLDVGGHLGVFFLITLTFGMLKHRLTLAIVLGVVVGLVAVLLHIIRYRKLPLTKVAGGASYAIISVALIALNLSSLQLEWISSYVLIGVAIALAFVLEVLIRYFKLRETGSY